MKALVLAGGTGTRLRPFSHSMPKQLIPIANKPVLEHVLSGIKDLGVTEIGLIVGDREPDIVDALGDGAGLGLSLTYLRQDAPRGLAHAVQVARGFLGDDDFVMYLGDNMLPDGVVEAAEQFRTHRPAAQVVVQKVADPRAFGVAELDAEGRVTRLVEKPQEPRSDLAMIGVYFFTSAVHEAVDSIEPSARGELEITDAVQWLVARGSEVRATEYTGYWKDTGRVEDVLDCNRQLLDQLVRSVDGEVDEESVLIGPVSVAPGARIVRSFIEGPAVIGPGSVIEDSNVGPHTSIGGDVTLSSTHISYSIALDGASVSGVHAVHGSVIGRSAAVSSGDLVTRRHRLVVGDHTRIEVAA
ncbi:glucose-1-phosphate thymidylyltransferase [Streptomyces sp. L2]|uniref:glucose-1-phosphate thymidylyltransferase n=1 Tax=Streptomyces sp. L2 TaxID=2162665 RepID=UPI00101170C3|nr:glucose-1-phosphate thymidylyltransferase [Streptomyces sp. L2]